MRPNRYHVPVCIYMLKALEGTVASDPELVAETHTMNADTVIHLFEVLYNSISRLLYFIF